MPTSTLKLWEKRINSNSKAIEEIVDRYGASNYTALRDVVWALCQAGSPLVAGTDSGNLPLLIPGYALHEELKLMVAMGIPVHDVLKMTTINAAIAMGKESEFGSIEVGKRADFLLLNANPLSSINHLQDKAGLMVRGVWLSAEELEKIMTDIREAFGN
ncbi:MAG: amidohydrolase family protein [Bacteroidia bacterium]|nr:amidohydrolase family protein [Bacteroidia bacterium]